MRPVAEPQRGPFRCASNPDDRGQAFSCLTAKIRIPLDKRMGKRVSKNWSGRPTEDQIWSIHQTWEAIPAVIERINDMLTNRMPGLEAMLADVGVRPSLGEPIRVPPRR